MKSIYPTRARARMAMERNQGAPSCTLATLETLAARVSGLCLSFSDPEAFHLEKHSIASELRRLARRGGRNA